MIRLVILGDIGSGKTFVSKCFNFPIFNADKEVQKIYKKNKNCFKKLNKKFPHHVKKFPISKKELKRILNKKNIKIYQSDKTFFQPNKHIYPNMYEFLIDNLSNVNDLLELYCGTGSFTLPLSNKFNKIFASENNRESIKMLTKSLLVNNISNIEIARLNAEEVIEIFSGRKFRRMNDIDINTYNFSHILVDPPRSGLDLNVINLVNNFENLIYISCNPDTYIRDIKQLNNFKVEKLALFDQFANTEHLEIVSILKKVN